MSYYKRVVRDGETLAFIIGNVLITNAGVERVLPSHKQACILANKIFDHVRLIDAKRQEIQDLLFRTV